MIGVGLAVVGEKIFQSPVFSNASMMMWSGRADEGSRLKRKLSLERRRVSWDTVMNARPLNTLKLTSLISIPSNSIFPFCNSKMRRRVRRRVLFPEPVRPVRIVRWLGGMVRVIFWRAIVSLLKYVVSRVSAGRGTGDGGRGKGERLTYMPR